MPNGLLSSVLSFIGVSDLLNRFRTSTDSMGNSERQHPILITHYYAKVTNTRLQRSDWLVDFPRVRVFAKCMLGISRDIPWDDNDWPASDRLKRGVASRGHVV